MPCNKMCCKLQEGVASMTYNLGVPRESPALAEERELRERGPGPVLTTVVCGVARFLLSSQS
jgi:hypothetical protein